jgi:ribose transport system substrate-binding protein
MNNESQAFAYKMFQKHMAEYNMQIDVLDDQGDAAKQAENVAQAVAKGYQWIIVNPTDAAGIVTALKAAKEANPNVLISTYSADVPDDSEQYRDFFVGINDTDAGQAAAQAFIDKFPDGCSLVEVGGQAGHNAQILRHDGFMAVMKDHPEFKILDSQNTEHWATDEAQSIMEDFVTKYGDQIQAVFCHWDNGATGCISALQAAGLNDVMIVGVDGCKAGFDQVNAGTQYATIMNNFETNSTTSMELAQKVLAGQKVDSDNYIKMDVVTKDNISSFTTPEW